MDYSSYMTMSCVIRRKLDEDEDTFMPRFSASQTRECFKYGKMVYVRQNDSFGLVSAQAYVMNKEISIGDEVDGQIVKSVNIIPEFDGTKVLYEALTWNS